MRARRSSWCWLALLALVGLAFGCNYPLPADVPSDSGGPDAGQTHELTAFKFTAAQNTGLPADVTATISGTTINANVLFGTSVTSLVATFSTTGATVTVNGVEQTSGVTANDFSSPVTYTVTAGDGTTRDYVVTITVASSTAKDLTSFSFLAANNSASSLSSDVVGLITGTTIAATVPFGTNVSTLKATFVITGQSVTVGGVTQVSGTTANNFTSSVIYRVTAADNSTKDYTVTVTVAAMTSKDITAFSFLMANNSALTADVVANISGTTITASVPFGTNVSALKATFTITGMSVTVGGVTQTSGVTANNFTSSVVYRVTAADNSTQDYTVSVIVGTASPNKDITTFSFLAANNSGLSTDVVANISTTSITATVPFGTNVTALKATFTITGTSITVGGVNQVSDTTANNFTTSVTYRVTAQDNTTKDYTVTVTIAPNTAKDLTGFSFLAVNNSGLPADVIANINNTAITATVPFGTNVTALKASFTTTGASVTVTGVTQVSGTTANNFTGTVTYRVTAADNSTKDYTVTVTITPPSTTKDITGFSFQMANNSGLTANVTGNISGTTITATVPFGTTVTALKATFTTTGASVTVGGVMQVSGTTANNFTGTVTYRVTAQDNSTQDYTVMVTIAPSPAKDITTYSFLMANNGGLSSNVTGNISGTTITATVPFGTNVTALKATFTTTGASVTVGGVTQVSNTTANNFTSSVVYRVTAADNSTQDYTVTVTILPSPNKDITAFSFQAMNNGSLTENATGTINGTAISVILPTGTNVTSLKATYTTTGASVTVNGVTQTSSMTANNFTNPVVYHVIAADNSTKDYTVTVTLAGGVSFGTFTSFSAGSLPEAVAVSDLNGDGKLDAAIVCLNANAVEVYLNTMAPGATTATLATKAVFTTGSKPNDLAIADFNLDGKPDVVVVNSQGASISVLLNTTAPGASPATFSTKVDFTTASSPFGVAVADFNGDGKPDVAAATFGNVTSVLLNTTAPGASTPSFTTKVDFTTGAAPVSITAADFNLDGLQDLAVANGQGPSVSVLLGTTTPGSSTPSFATKVDFATASGPRRVATGDFNGDGRPDIATGNDNNTVSVLLGTTAPGATTATFATKVDLSTGINNAAVNGIAVGDVTGDGIPDIAAATLDGNIGMLRNTTSPGGTAATFAANVVLPMSNAPQTVALADLNGDGRPDLVSASESSNVVTISLNTSVWVRNLAFAAKSDTTVGTGPHGVTVGDLNLDGKPDVVAVNQGGANVSVLLSTTTAGASTATMTAAVNFTTGTSPFQAAIVDVNGDGRPDIVVANAGGSISVLRNTMTSGAAVASFATKVDFTTGTSPESLAIGDFNHDGKPDAAVANVGDNTVSVLLNTTATGSTTITFATKADFATATTPFAIAAADFNGDGNRDLVVCNQGSDSISVLLNTTAVGATTATFATKVDFTTGTQPSSVAVGDLNGDGVPDIAVANAGANTASIFLNQTTAGGATPTLTAKTDFAISGNPFGIAIGDLNGDGKLDVAASNTAGNAGVITNTTPLGATTPTFAAVSTFTAGSGTYAIAIGQFNGDGKLDIVVANNGANSVSVLLGN